MCEEEKEASHLDVCVYTLAKFLCSIYWTNDAVNKIDIKMNYLYERFFFSSLRMVYVSSFSHHTRRRAEKEIFSGILSRSSKVDQNQRCVCI